MKRRQFMQLSAAAGTGLLGGVNLGWAQQAYPGPYWLFIEARGGWDPTSFCDPKGRGLGPNGDINNYDQGDIGQAGNIPYAPPPDSFLPGQPNFINGLFSNQQFFDAHFQRLLVINGISYGTNSHSVGRTAAWSGTKTLDYPSLGALIANQSAPDLPLPYVASRSGESTKTKGVVPATVLSGSDLNAIREIAFPNRSNVFNGNSDYYEASTDSLIDSAVNARAQRQMANQRLDRVQSAMATQNQLMGLDSSTLSDFVNGLNSPSAPNAYVASRNRAEDLFDRAQRAFAAFEAGAAATAHIHLDGFDTHDDHDVRHYPRLMDYLGAVDNIIDDAVNRGMGDNLVIVMTSDFARTNRYNNDNGKDHWSHGSMMVWGAPGFFGGNRVVGLTNDNQVSQPINATTLQPDAGGIVLTNEYVHQALRDLAGVAGSPMVTSQFPFGEQILPIFS